MTKFALNGISPTLRSSLPRLLRRRCSLFAPLHTLPTPSNRPPFREPFAIFLRRLCEIPAAQRFGSIPKNTRRKSSSRGRETGGGFLIRKKKTRFVNGRRAREGGLYAVKMAWPERVFAGGGGGGGGLEKNRGDVEWSNLVGV